MPIYDSYIPPPYVRTTTTRGHGGARGRGGDAAAGGDGGREDTSQLRSRSSPLLLSSTSAGTAGKRVYRSVSYHLLSLSLPLSSPPRVRFALIPSLLTFVTMRCVGFLTVPVFAISIARFCRDACDASRVLSLTYIGRVFLYPPKHLRYLLFLNLPFSLAFDKILSSREPSSYNTKL